MVKQKATTGVYQNEFSTTEALNAMNPSTGSTVRSRSTNTTANSKKKPASLSSNQGSVNILALLDNPSREVGFASFNLRTNTVYLTQYSESSSYINTCNMLKVYEPTEVIFPKTLYDSKLALVVKQELEINEGIAKAKTTFIARKFFTEGKGNEFIDTLLMDEKNSSIKTDTVSKYLSVSALAAVVQYVEYVQEITFQPRTIRIVYVPCDGFLLLDSSSISSLEIVRSLKYGSTNTTLLSHIDHTKTPMGKRVLRSNILQPLLDINSLNARLDCVEEILGNEKNFFEVGSLLGEFNVDLSHLLTQFTHAKKTSANRSGPSVVMNIICLRRILEKLPLLFEKLEEYSNPILLAISKTFENEDVEPLKTEIDEMINEKTVLSCKNRQQQITFAIKTGVDGLLDIGRKKYIETVEEIHEHHKNCQTEAGLSTLKLKYNVRRGYHFSFEDKNISHEAQKLFIQRSKKGKTTHCSTQEMNSLNVKLREVLDEIFLLTEMVVGKLVEKIRGNISSLFKVSESIGLLDMLYSFATTVTLNTNYVRPEFCLDGPIAIKQGRHPVLEKSLNGGVYVPNDTYLSESSNLHIITGANMSGKSTYLKQIACIQILSQIGSFVPCSYCNVRIADRIFTRIGTNDSIENNSSTFMVEMKEISNIVQNATQKSLVIIDELGRSSSNIEGTSIAWSVAEFLSSLRSYTLFATHYTELSDLESLYPNIKNAHLKVTTTQDGELNYLYQLQSGSCSEDRYGIKLAKMLGIPSSIIEESETILTELLARKHKPSVEAENATKDWRIVFSVVSKLIAQSDSSLENFKNLVQKLKQ